VSGRLPEICAGFRVFVHAERNVLQGAGFSKSGSAFSFRDEALFPAERSHVLASDKAHSPDSRFIREMNFSVFSAKSPGKLSRR